MFESLLLKNFQVHGKRRIDFDRRITTIVGESDAGKSAIVRALRWLCLNEAAGGFRKHGSCGTTVRLRVDNHTVTRKRTDAKNLYYLDNQKFSAVRSNIPDQVADLLAVHRSISFQSQFEGFYWLSKSAGEVSRELNAIVSLDVIDKTLSNVSAELRKAHATYNVTEQRFKAAKEEAKKLAWVEKAQRRLKQVEALFAEWQATRKKAANLRSLVRELQGQQKSYEEAVGRLLDGKKALLHGRRARAAARKARQLRQLIRDLEKAKRDSLLQLPNIEELGRTIEQRTKLAELITQIKTQEKLKCQVQKRLQSSSRLLDKKLKGRCPVCGRK